MISRQCVRALLEDEHARVLLMKIVEPSSGRAFWITPGGGCDDGESDRAALARELREETGLLDVPGGPHVWTRDFAFDWEGERYSQSERFYWLKVPSFDPSPTALQGAIETDAFSELRWWTVEEIDSSDETFAPLDLAAQLSLLRSTGAPEVPVIVGA